MVASRTEAMTEVWKVLNKLNKLEPDEIAEFFRDRDIKGGLTGSRVCPVARYIKNELKWAEVVLVSSIYASAYPEGGLSPDDREIGTGILMPPNVVNFIRKFDHREYDFLIDR